MSVSRMVFFCASIPVVLFDTPGTSKCLNMFLFSSRLYFIIGFFCDSLVVRNDLWIG